MVNDTYKKMQNLYRHCRNFTFYCLECIKYEKYIKSTAFCIRSRNFSDTWHHSIWNKHKKSHIKHLGGSVDVPYECCPWQLFKFFKLGLFACELVNGIKIFGRKLVFVKGCFVFLFSELRIVMWLCLRRFYMCVSIVMVQKVP